MADHWKGAVFQELCRKPWPSLMLCLMTGQLGHSGHEYGQFPLVLRFAHFITDFSDMLDMPV